MGFSKNLFWDADPSQIDLHTHRRYVVERVLNRGTLADIKNIISPYGREQLIDIALNLRTLEPKALSFFSCISGIPREKFRCYTAKRSSPAPWFTETPSVNFETVATSVADTDT